MEIRQLTETEFAALNDGLALAVRLVDHKIDVSAVQELYNAVVDAERRTPSVIIATGLAFGQLFLAEPDFEWVRVKDEFGEETAVALKEVQLVCHPVSMMQKRLNNNEAVDVSELLRLTIRTLRAKAETGEHSPR